jgi:NAD+ synthase (glutamine-hydrolysing)
MTQPAAPPFHSPFAHDFVRLGVCTPAVRPADPAFNAAAILAQVREADAEGASLLVFPELGISAYAIDDLHHQTVLLDAVEAALADLARDSAGLTPAFVVGAPLRRRGRLYNCGVVIHAGRLVGAVPKSYLPNYREFYEPRWFTPGHETTGEIEIAGEQVPFGTDLLFRSTGLIDVTFHVEICEDVWAPEPPSTLAAVSGAEVLLNLSASNIVIGKAQARRTLCAAQSMRCLAAYAYSAAGPGESTTDLAWDGHGVIFENGRELAETARFSSSPTLALADVDLALLRAERIRTRAFGESPDAADSFRRLELEILPPAGPQPLLRQVERFPYVPADPARLAEDCAEAYQIQVQGLAQRLRSTGLQKLVIGVSGGLDSTQALIVAARVMDQLGLPRSHVLAYTLPGFATSDGTRSNAWALMRSLGVTAAEIDIRPAANQMLADLGHPAGRGEPVYDVTFENVQAGLRTDYLFRLANQAGALVVGTGDLSELGLGWCTYGVGDHMSHYNPNASVSKTLIQHLIRFVAASKEVSDEVTQVLHAILATEISPELVPAGADGAVQSTESFVGPYALQDFNLFYLSRYGFAPSRIAYLALQAWGDAGAGNWPANTPDAARRAYDLATIKAWLALFLKRFFANQFKRSAVPNGPKISSGGSLSPRGDWRMPSDAGAQAWLDELARNTPDS